MSLLELPPRHPPQAKVAAYMHHLELSSRCSGESRASQSVMDLTTVLSDKTALQQVVRDLFRPFESLHVDQVVALHVERTITPDDDNNNNNGEISANGKKKEEEVAASAGTHRFTTAIAGAIAGTKELSKRLLVIVRAWREG